MFQKGDPAFRIPPSDRFFIFTEHLWQRPQHENARRSMIHSASRDDARVNRDTDDKETRHELGKQNSLFADRRTHAVSPLKARFRSWTFRRRGFGCGGTAKSNASGSSPKDQSKRGTGDGRDVEQQAGEQSEDDADVEAHKRSGDADESVGDIADAGGMGNMTPEPATSTTTENEADDNADQHQKDKGGDGCCENGHGKLLAFVVRLKRKLPARGSK